MKYIFCINTGRCGSHYLTELAKAAVDTVSLHEPQPMGAGLEMTAFNQNQTAPMQKVVKTKLKEISRLSQKGKLNYLETNHTFIKGFGWLLPQYLNPKDIRIIILSREKNKVIQSLKRVRCIPGKTEWARTWYLSPGMIANLTEPPPAYTDDEICDWYIDEIKTRTQKYCSTFPNLQYIEVDLNDLNNFDFVVDLFKNKLGLKINQEILRKKIGSSPYEINKEFHNPPPLNPAYINPDQLNLKEQQILRKKILTHLQEKYQDKLFSKTDKVVGNWHTMIPSVISIITGNEADLMQQFAINLPQTNFEMTLIIWLVHQLRLFDPYGLIHCKEGNTYRFPAMNKAPTAALPVMAYNFFKILKNRYG